MLPSFRVPSWKTSDNKDSVLLDWTGSDRLLDWTGSHHTFPSLLNKFISPSVSSLSWLSDWTTVQIVDEWIADHRFPFERHAPTDHKRHCWCVHYIFFIASLLDTVVAFVQIWTHTTMCMRTNLQLHTAPTVSLRSTKSHKLHKWWKCYTPYVAQRAKGKICR
jgi:hypothetical protein